jgi:hypothetical protein
MEFGLLKLMGQLSLIALGVYVASAAVGKKDLAKTVDKSRRPLWGGGTEKAGNAFDFSLVSAPLAQKTSYTPGPIGPQTTY